MTRKGIYLTLLFTILCTCIIACGRKGTEYIYKNPALIEELQISKTRYMPQKLTLYYEGQLDDTYQVSCYDKNFQKINEEWEISCNRGKLVIKGADAEKISGVRLENGSRQFYIRYLESEQYAILYNTWADDIGWKNSSGDSKLYYTQEEVEKQNEAKRKYIEQQQEYWRLLQGEWVVQSDDRMSLCFYTEDDCHLLRFTDLVNGEVSETIIRVDLIEQWDSSDDISLSLYEGAEWGTCYGLSLSLDHTTITFENQSYTKSECTTSNDR